MTFPPGMTLADVQSAPRGGPLFVSWLFAFGILPFDRHVLGLDSLGTDRFVEVSHSLLQRVWRHERSVLPVEGGCRVRDIVTVAPRIGVLAPLTRIIVAAIFRHRHKRLTVLYR